MRSLGMLFVFVSALAVTSLCHGQGTEEKNVAYENLKLLEPMIGTWQMTWADEETGTQGVWELTCSWTASKRMIATTTKTGVRKRVRALRRTRGGRETSGGMCGIPSCSGLNTAK